jgi:hypothetical protein
MCDLNLELQHYVLLGPLNTMTYAAIEALLELQAYAIQIVTSPYRLTCEGGGGNLNQNVAELQFDLRISEDIPFKIVRTRQSQS